MQLLVAANSIKNHKLIINLKLNLKNLSLKIKGLKKSPKPKINRLNSYKISPSSLSIKLKKWVPNFGSTATSITPSLNTKKDFPYLDRKSIDSTLSSDKKQENSVMSTIDTKCLKIRPREGQSTSVNFSLRKVNSIKKICNCRWKWQKVSEVSAVSTRVEIWSRLISRIYKN